LTIPLLDLQRVHGPILEEMVAAARGVLESGRFIMGPEVTAFEEEVGSFLGARHAIGVSNGTDALRASLSVLAMLKGKGKVLTTPFTFVATAEAIAAAGLEPVFVDVTEETALMDLDNLPEPASAGIVGIVPVHLFGQCLPMDRLCDYAAAGNIWIVEDAAQSFGAGYKGRMSGTIGEAGCYSFFPSKNLGGAGDGGLITTNDDELARWFRASRVHGVLTRKYHTDFFSGNYRLDALQAAILRVKLKHVARWNRERAEVGTRYDRLFREAGLLERGDITPLASVPGSDHVYHQYVVKARRRDEVAAGLQERGISSAVYYPVPLHLQKAFHHLGYRPEDLPVSMLLSTLALALPVFPGMTAEEQEMVVGTISDFFAKERA
jgi:dTDP-4-amino-4,6-dideoxygalactose transaminase